jgi:site-specific DNA-methyltransferase (adenine-specific)
MSNVTLYNGNNLSILMTIPNESIDVLITDPPYSSGGLHTTTRQQSTAKKYLSQKHTGFGAPELNFEGDNRDQRSWTTWCTLWLTECYRTLKTGSPAAIFTDWRQLPSLTDAFQAAGFIWRGVYVWDKKNARPNAGKFRQTAEFVVWGSKGEMQIDKATPIYLGGMTSAAIVQTNRRKHQTEKPEILMRDLVKIAKPDSIILDPFMGSGSTGVAALAQGHKFIGIEINKHYYNVAKQRLNI